VDAVSVLAVAAVGAAGAVLVLRADPAWTLSVGIALSVFSGNWDRLGAPVALDRLVLLAALAVVVLRLGAARDRPPIRLGAVHLLLAAAAAWAVASAAWAGTLGDRDARFALLDGYGLLPFAVFAVAPVVFRDEARRRVLLGVLVVLGGYLGLTAVLESAGPRALVVPQWILDPAFGAHGDRARGPFVQAVANGIAMFGCGVAAAIALHVWRGRGARVGAAAVAGLCAAGIVVTYTRANWLGALAGALVALACFAELRRFLGPAVAAGAVALAAAVLLVPGLGQRLEDRYEDRGPVDVRRGTNQAALSMLAERPALGHGWATFRERSPDHFRELPDVRLSGVGEDAHNVLLRNAVELGVLGALLWAAALAVALGGALVRRGPPALRPWRIGFAAFATCWLVSANLSPVPYLFVALLLWTWAGLLYAGGATTSRRSQGKARSAWEGERPSSSAGHGSAPGTSSA
jgi:putative inorganic carbon (hco3(-)) transporter